MGGKGSGGKKGQELIKTGVRFAQQAERQSLPARTLGNQQATELLATGGIGARIPLIAKALEAARAGTGDARAQLEANLASSGLAGTPYGIAALNKADVAAGLGESQVQQNAANSAIGQIAQILNLGPVQAAPFAGGTSAAINAGAGSGADNSGLYSGLGSLLGSIAANASWGGGGGGGGTPIGPTYGGGNLAPAG